MINTGGADMNLKVLAIDDDHAMTELLTLLLKTHGFNVLTANTGEDGVSLALKESPNVIILDLMMPGMDGWQVCSQIRTFSACPSWFSQRSTAPAWWQVPWTLVRTITWSNPFPAGC